MLRFLGFATLILVAACLVLGASIALAVGRAAPAEHRTIEAADSDRRPVDEFLAAVRPSAELGEPSDLPEL